MSVGEGMSIFLMIADMLVEVLTVEQASYHYKFAKTTIRGWCDEDKLIAHKVAGILLIEKSSIEHFLKRDFCNQKVAQ